MKIKYGTRYGNKDYTSQTVWVRPETPWETRFINAIHDSMGLQLRISDGYMWSGFVGNVKRIGECEGCVYSTYQKDYIACKGCSRRPRCDNYRKPKKGPSMLMSLMKGLPKKKR